MKGMIQVAVYLALLGPIACWGADPEPPRHRYDGMSHVSGAVAIAEDMFIACSGADNVLRVYRTEGSTAPVACLDVSAFLGLDGEPADLCGAAKIADRVYWITSHSRDEEGRVRPGRYRFFATTIERNNGKIDIKPVGKPCTTLLNRLPNLNTVSTLRLDKALQLGAELSERQRQRLTPTKEGLNIEALGADPQIGTLFLGFRNPRPVRVTTGRPHALVVPLNNASDVVEKGSAPIFGEALLWDFEGLGITNIEYSSSHGCYFLLAQPHDQGSPGVLYRWSGLKATPPEQVCRLGLSSRQTASAAIVAFDNSPGLLLLTGSDSPDTAAEERHFQGSWIQP